MGAAADEIDFTDGHGYPTDIATQIISSWPVTDIQGLFVFAKSLWWAPEYFSAEEIQDGYDHPAIRLNISTAGWSGNEELVGALQDTILWLVYWQSSRRGGHHVIDIPLSAWGKLNTPILGDSPREC